MKSLGGCCLQFGDSKTRLLKRQAPAFTDQVRSRLWKQVPLATDESQLPALEGKANVNSVNVQVVGNTPHDPMVISKSFLKQLRRL